MTIPSSAKGTPLPKPDSQAQFVDPQTGSLTSHGLQLLGAIRDYVNGGNRVIPCSASGTNVITLQPNVSTPFLQKYLDYEVFVFTAANDSTGSVTVTVVPVTGTLATLKAFKTNGATQAGSGDIKAGSVYFAIFAEHLDTAAGGFVIK